MVILEKTLTECCGGRGKTGSAKFTAKWARKCKLTEEELSMTWYTNVYILLKLKVIVNDEMNGMLFVATPRECVAEVEREAKVRVDLFEEFVVECQAMLDAEQKKKVVEQTGTMGSWENEVD